MTDLATRLAELEQLARTLAYDAMEVQGVRALDEHTLIEVLNATGRVQRLVEAVQIEAVGEVEDRHENSAGEGRMAHRFGCHNVSELVQRTTRLSPASAARLTKAAKATRQGVSPTTGELLDPALPALREALRDGVVGVDGTLAIASPLLSTRSRASRDAVLTADGILAADARGEGPDAAPPACADLLRVQAQAWAMALDPDGAEPRERMASHRRGLTIGAATEHGVPVRGMLMHEVAAQFQRIADAVLNPRVNPDALPGVRFTEGDALGEAPAPVDARTRAQKLHDVLATALTVAASSELLPTVGGAAPTLVVNVREEDIVKGRGFAHVDGADEPVALTVARHVGCAGVVQRVVISDTGRITSLGTEARVFNRHQRRAIALRDGGCLIPGCGVAAAWCEIHHVTEHSHGGPTHTENGVLLCWYHHRFIDFNGWKIRMNRGVPEVKAPNWIDAYGTWRTATTSRTRLLNAVLRT